MEVVCRCTSCDAQFKVDEKYAGRKAKCPKCATVVVVPAPDLEATVAKAAASANTVMIKAPRKSESASPIEINVGATRAQSSAPATSSNLEIKVASEGPAVAVASQPSVAIDVAAPKTHAVATSAPAERKPAKPQAKSALVPIMVGGVLSVVAVGGAFGAYFLLSGSAGKNSGKSLLVIELGSVDRKEASVSIDGKKQTLPSKGEIKFELKAGEHKLAIQRRGYEPIDDTVKIKSGRLPYKPKWKESSVAGVTPKPSGLGAPGAAGSSFNSAESSGVNGYPGWLQNMEVARRRAGESKKDLLLVFVSSDSSAPCKALLRDVFSGGGFRQLAESKFVPVVIDLPSTSAGYNMIEDRAQNTRLQMQYHISADDLPTLVLVDGNGRPYATHESYDGQGTRYLEKLRKSLDDRAERDRVLGLPAAATGEKRLAAAKEAAGWLQSRKLLGHFPAEVRTWLEYAKQYDPNNEQGAHEVMFEADWLCRLTELTAATVADSLRKHVAELETWQQARKFRDANRGARLHLLAAMFLARLNDAAGAARQVELGLAYNPTDPKLLEGLKAGSSALAQAGQLGSGSGFVVGEEGYILTNHHVIDGPGKVVVRLSDLKKDTIPATVLAKDAKRDMALLKVTLPGGTKLAPVIISSTEMRRGARVAAFGFPLGDAIGQGLKLTQGAIGALADPSNEGMMLLDMRVNPGNSGGPLCDARGQVIGIVTAKIGGGDQADSYGLARSAPDVLDFLQKNMPGFTPRPPSEKKEGLEWDEVDRIVSPSVVMILKMEG